MDLKEWEKLSPEEQEKIFKNEPPIQLGKPLTPIQEMVARQAMAGSQLADEASVATIDAVLSHAPECIDEHTLHTYRTNFKGAVDRAGNCEIKEMVSNLLMLAETHDEIIDEMAHYLRRDILPPEGYDKYARTLGLFQRRTVPDVITHILEGECGCGKREESPEELFRNMGKKL